MPVVEFLIQRFPELKTSSLATTVGRFTTALSLPIAQVEAERQDRTRSGRMFSGMSGTTGVAPVQAVPTTTAAVALYNADPNRSYVIDSIVWTVLTGVSALNGTTCAIVSPITSTAPTSASGSTVGSASSSSLQSRAVMAQAYTIPTPALTAEWMFYGTMTVPGGSGVGGSVATDIKGGIIVPPGRVLGLSLFAGAGTSPTYVCCVNWFETQLDLE